MGENLSKSPSTYVPPSTNVVSIRWNITFSELKRIARDGSLASKKEEILSIPGSECYLEIFTLRLNYYGNRIFDVVLMIPQQKMHRFLIECTFSIMYQNTPCFLPLNQTFFMNCGETIGYKLRTFTFDQVFEKSINIQESICLEFIGHIKRESLDKVLTFANKPQVVNNLWNADNKDFMICNYGKEIHVHKCVLSNASPAFKAMIESGMKETKKNKATIEGFEFEIVEYAIKHCYGIDKTNFTYPEAWRLLELADMYQLKILKERMEKRLITEICKKNVCEIVNYSFETNAQMLRDQCSRFLIMCIKNSVYFKDVDSLGAEYAKELLKKALLSSEK